MSGTRKVLFLDRDGTLIQEPADFQIDSLEKFALVPGTIRALTRLRDAGYRFVLVTNQDGLGTDRYPQAAYDEIQKLLVGILASEGIRFEAVKICPHFESDRCQCRKPSIQMVQEYLADPELDRKRSYVIGDRETDLLLAQNMRLAGLRISAENGWERIADTILLAPREAICERNTKETKIRARVNLDGTGATKIHTGIGFFDHMLDQIARHAGFDLELQVEGDTHVDDHHTIEDSALALGAALREALGDKRGIGRFGFFLPMDDASAQVAIDLSGRAFSKFEGGFDREYVGEMATEMVPHFFRSFADGLNANIHIRIEGQNTHHRVESAFKAVGRSLRAAIARSDKGGIPSTKGVL